MCVKQNRGSEVCEGDFSPELFSRLEAAFPHTEALILNGIGEPLLNPHLESFIRRAKKLMPSSGWIGFQSNGGQPRGFVNVVGLDPAGRYIYSVGNVSDFTTRQTSGESQWALQATVRYEF